MITLRRIELVRQDSHATAEELQNLQAQLNAQFDALRKTIEVLQARLAALEAP